MNSRLYKMKHCRQFIINMKNYFIVLSDLTKYTIIVNTDITDYYRNRNPWINKT